MTTVDSPQTPYKTPSATRESGEIFHGQVESAMMQSQQNDQNSVATSHVVKEASVAHTVATISGTVNDQIRAAEIMSRLRSRFAPIFPELSLSTWIDGAAEVDEYARIVSELNRLRNLNEHRV